jgi:hypothetical protein
VDLCASEIHKFFLSIIINSLRDVVEIQKLRRYFTLGGRNGKYISIWNCNGIGRKLQFFVVVELKLLF